MRASRVIVGVTMGGWTLLSVVFLYAPFHSVVFLFSLVSVYIAAYALAERVHYYDSLHLVTRSISPDLFDRMLKEALHPYIEEWAKRIWARQVARESVESQKIH